LNPIKILIKTSLYLLQNSTHKLLLVCNWLHSVGQNQFFVMMLFKQGFCYSEVWPEDSAQFASQKI
jgi:hypothetical protein